MALASKFIGNTPSDLYSNTKHGSGYWAVQRDRKKFEYAINVKNLAEAIKNAPGSGAATVRFCRHGQAVNGFAMLFAR